MDWKKYVKEDKKMVIKKNRVLIGNAEKIIKLIGWKPSVSFKDMIKMLVDKEMQHAL
jgi:GDP-D-mannose dehydratase